jgi:hypothetical protein
MAAQQSAQRSGEALDEMVAGPGHVLGAPAVEGISHSLGVGRPPGRQGKKSGVRGGPRVAVAVLAIIYAEATGKATSDVLFSGEDALDPLITHAASYSVGALLLLMVCKGLAYAVSLSSFRGGPVFPAMFIGAAGGIALSHLPGLPMIAGVAMGIGAMSVVMLTLPITSVLLATLLLASDGLALMPVVIVAYVAAARITPAETTGSATRERPAATAGSDSDVVSL